MRSSPTNKNVQSVIVQAYPLAQTVGVLSLRVIDAQSNQELQRKNLKGSYVWNTTWVNYKGDDRALTGEDKKNCTREPQMPPSPQDMFIEFTKPIHNQAVSHIRSVYVSC